MQSFSTYVIIHISHNVFFHSLQARLSNVVEAEPDCKVAMDILGFALYHENSGDVDGTASKVDKVTDDEGSDSSVGDTDEIGGNKRRRLDEEGRSSNLIKSRIWDEITAADGELPLEEACPAMDDRESVMKAVDEMVDEGRVMVSDGIMYTID